MIFCITYLFITIHTITSFVNNKCFFMIFCITYLFITIYTITSLVICYKYFLNKRNYKNYFFRIYYYNYLSNNCLLVLI